MPTVSSGTRTSSLKFENLYKDSLKSIDFSPVDDLINDFYLRNYPIDPNSSWQSLSTVLDKLHEDEKLSKFLFKGAGLMDDKGTWDERLIMSGMIQQFDVVESEPAIGYHMSIEITLVSELGYLFLDAFFDLIAKSK